ncbi:MAG: hypothetical protein OHK0012_15660 [Synechococcales cyanobacterium]
MAHPKAGTWGAEPDRTEKKLKQILYVAAIAIDMGKLYFMKPIDADATRGNVY